MAASKLLARWRQWLFALFGVCACLHAHADVPASEAATLADDNMLQPGHLTKPAPYNWPQAAESTVAPTDVSPPAKPEPAQKSEWVIAPVPGYSPGQGGSLALITQYIFKPEGQSEKTQPTTIGLAGAMTEQKSYAVGAGYRGSLADDLWRVQTFVAQGKYNYDFYGVGQAAGSQGLHVPIEQSFTTFQLQGLRRAIDDIYFGPRLSVMRSNLATGAVSGLPIEVPSLQLDRDLKTIALGLRVQWDTRNEIFYPTNGYYVQSRVDWYRKAYGSDFNYQIFDAEYNQYISFSTRDVLAVRGFFRKASDGTPFFALSTFGGNDLRGYENGRYRDQIQLVGQAEWRHQLSPRWAAVGFTGLGSVAPTVAALRHEDILWSYGGGLRFRIAQNNKVNFRLDWARGRDGSTLYFSVGEAF